MILPERVQSRVRDLFIVLYALTGFAECTMQYFSEKRCFIEVLQVY